MNHDSIPHSIVRRTRLESQVPTNRGSKTWKFISHRLNIFVASPRKTDDDVLALAELLGPLHRSVNGMG